MRRFSMAGDSSPNPPSPIEATICAALADPADDVDAAGDLARCADADAIAWTRTKLLRGASAGKAHRHDSIGDARMTSTASATHLQRSRAA
jgi:hypothetical protein